MKSLRAALYGLGRALGGTTRRPLVTLLATGAVAVSLLLVGVVYLAAANVARLTGSFERGVQMVVYLEDGTTPDRARSIAAVLQGVRGVESVDFVAPDEAFRRLSESLGERRDLLQGVEVGYLPASLEVSLAGGLRDVAAVSPLVERLRAAPGVEEVEFLGDWVDRLAALKRALNVAGLALALLVAAACVYVVGSTIRLGALARKDEIEILRLVGATDRFVRAPLVVEGALVGAVGAAIAALLLLLLHQLGGPPLERMLSSAVGDLRIVFLHPAELGVGLLAGLGLGATGSWLAVGAREPEHA